MGVQASIGGAIGLAGQAARRLWALNSKGRRCEPYIVRLLTMGPIGFHSMPGLTSRHSPAFLQPFVPLAQNWALGHFTPSCASTKYIALA